MNKEPKTKRKPQVGIAWLQKSKYRYNKEPPKNKKHISQSQL